jgi:type IV secretory pathway VirB10-like protein
MIIAIVVAGAVIIAGVLWFVLREPDKPDPDPSPSVTPSRTVTPSPSASPTPSEEPVPSIEPTIAPPPPEPPPTVETAPGQGSQFCTTMVALAPEIEALKNEFTAIDQEHITDAAAPSERLANLLDQVAATNPPDNLRLPAVNASSLFRQFAAALNAPDIEAVMALQPQLEAAGAQLDSWGIEAHAYCGQ